MPAAMLVLLTFCLSWCSLRSSRSPTDLCVARSVFSAESIQSSNRSTSSSNLINSSLHSCSCRWRDSLSWYTCRRENSRYFCQFMLQIAQVSRTIGHKNQHKGNTKVHVHRIFFKFHQLINTLIHKLRPSE